MLHRSLIGLALCALAAGCGGDDAPSDREQIVSVLVRVGTSTSAEVLCDTGVSARFVREVYGSLKHCRAVNSGTTDTAPEASVVVTKTRIAGNRATSAMELEFGESEGPNGDVALVKAGGTWKLDRYGTTFMRSSVAMLAGEGGNAEGRALARCLAVVAGRLPDASLVRTMNAFFGERLDDLPATMSVCRLGAARALEVLKDGAFEEFDTEEEKLPAATRACVKRNVRALIGEDELAATFEMGDLPATFARALKRALVSCQPAG